MVKQWPRKAKGRNSLRIELGMQEETKNTNVGGLKPKEKKDHAELLYETTGRSRDFSHPLKPTTKSVQQKAKQVIATAIFRNIMTSSRPRLMAAIMTSSVDNMNTKPPQAKKKLPRASVGGREGRMDFGGLNHRKKYVKQRRTENATSRFPQRAWIWTSKR